MIKTLYLVEKERNGKYGEPRLLTEDGLVELAREYDPDIETDVVYDFLESTMEFQITEINNLEEMQTIFNNILKDYMNYDF